MAFVAGYNGVIKLDATIGGSLTAYTAYFESFDVSLTTDSGETTTLGDAFRDFIPTLKSLEFSGTYRSDATFSAVLAAHYNSQTVGSSVSYELSPEGTASGTVKITGECWQVSWNPNATVDGVCTGTVSYKSTGTITVGTN